MWPVCEGLGVFLLVCQVPSGDGDLSESMTLLLFTFVIRGSENFGTSSKCWDKTFRTKI